LGRRSLLAKILGQTGPVPSKTPIFNRFSLVAPYAVTSSEKSLIITSRKSTTRFSHAYVACKPQRRLNNAK